MKKILVTLFSLAALTATTNAQEVKTLEVPTQTKEQKEAAKAKKEADLVEAFKKSDITEEQQKAARAIMDATNEKSKLIKKDATLNEEGKKAKLDELNKEKNEKLKELMGEYKFKAFQAARKAQKEAEKAAATPVKE